jgi:hypothetical protein
MFAAAACSRICSSVLPSRAIQRFANRTGEYQRPPSMNMTMAATNTASQLIAGKCSML